VPRTERQLFPERSILDRFGFELRTWRKSCGLSLDRLGRAVHVSGDLLAKIEVAERRPTGELAKRCDDVLNAGGALIKVWEAYDQAQRQLRQERARADGPYIATGTSAPAAAGTGQAPAPHLPGTAGEGAAMTMGAEVPADSVAGAAGWGDHIIIPCQASDGRIIWMSVPRRAFLLGGIGAVSAAAAGAGTPNDLTSETLPARLLASEVNPFEHWQEIRKVLAANDNLLGPRYVIPAARDQIRLMVQWGKEIRGADRVQLLQLQIEFADLLAWMYQDARNYGDAQYWLDRALEWSHAVGATHSTAVILARKCELACDLGEALDAVSFGEAAVSCAPPDNPASAIAATYVAHGYALQHEDTACGKAYDRALKAFEGVAGEWAWYGRDFIGTRRVEAWRARSLSVLGDSRQSAQVFAAVLDTWPSAWRRGRGVHLARKACAHAAAGEVDEAVDAGMQSLAIAAQTRSARNVNELGRLNGALSPWQASPAVAEFRSAARELELSLPAAPA
jgi:tetratricopeptide (TPR) repeat protein